MSEIKAVTKYLTSDGDEWDNEEGALEWQAVLNFIEDYVVGTTTLEDRGWKCDAKPLSSWILKNKEAVLILLGYEDMV